MVTIIALVLLQNLAKRRNHFAVGSIRRLPVGNEEHGKLWPRSPKIMAHRTQSPLGRIAPYGIAVSLSCNKSSTATRAVLRIPLMHDQRAKGSSVSFSVRKQVGDLSA